MKLYNKVLEKRKEKADLALIRSIAKSEHAILTRNEDLLQQAETEMSQSIQLAERGYGNVIQLLPNIVNIMQCFKVVFDMILMVQKF